MDALAALIQTLPALTEALGPVARTTLYDLRTTPPTVLAVHGRFGATTAANACDPLPAAGASRLVTTEQGRVVRSSWTSVTDGTTSVAALHIEVDVTMWADLGAHAEWCRTVGPAADSAGDRPSAGMEEQRTELVRAALERIGVPVGLMLKNHKLAVVRELDANGFFLLRESVPYLASTLSVSRHSIYNYLNSVRETETSRS